MKKTIIITSIVLVVLVAAVGTAWQMGFLDAFSISSKTEQAKVSDEKFDEIKNSDSFKEADISVSSSVQGNTVQVNDVKIAIRDELEVWQEMHKMSNTKINADQIWGKVDITNERLNMLILEVEKSNYKTKNELLKILYRWKEGDFRQAIADHNYLWGNLGGTVGKAVSLNTKVKDEMALKYRK